MILRASSPPSMPPAAPHFLALFDYDGTVTTRECMEIVLGQLAGDAWRPFEDEVRRGRLSHAECLRRQIALVRAPHTELLDALVAAAELTPGLAAFLATLAARGGRGAVVSAGFRLAIEAFWRREGLPPIDVYASEIILSGPDGASPLGIAFSDAFGDCPRCGPASCKAAVLRALRRPGDTVLVFGDGSSDLTFARDHLADRCAAEQLPWLPLDDYTTIWQEVDRWRERRRGLDPATCPGF